MQTYTSPHTGLVYEVQAVPQSRTDYRVPGDGNTMYERHYIEYQFFRQNQKVTWTYDMDVTLLRHVFGELEGVYGRREGSPRD
jgi:hypothetical protein